MKGLLLALGGGAVLYYLYEQGYLGNVAATTAGTTTGTATSPQAGDSTNSMTAPTQTGGSNTGTSQLAMLWAKIQNAIKSDTYFSFHDGDYWSTPYHWAFYVTYFNPSMGVALEQVFPGVDLTAQMSGSQFYSAIAPYLKAMYGLSGLGVIANRVNPYTLGPRVAPHQKFGAGLAPNGMETYIIQKGQA